MEIFKTILTSWPLAAVIIVFAIRGSLKKIIESRLSSLKVGNVEFTFFEQLARGFDENLKKYDEDEKKSNPAQENYNDKQSPSNTQDFQNNKGEDSKESAKEKLTAKKIKSRPIKIEFHDRAEMFNLAIADPQKLVQISWQMVEDELLEIKNLYSFQGVSTKKSTYDLLEQYKIIPTELATALMHLSFMHKLLIVQKELNSGEAYEFFSRCTRAVDELRKIV
ncbi:hypothetical protein NQS41_10110 [Bacillus sp. C3(2022)]|uniref:hypothetical protein n=1 Tax=Bacillus TaxID=1386 RepID=UPI0011A3CF44|nr:hypothetical protein [Bacillus licheniformis]TWJ94319.1 hypothetical protein CHCC20493_0479 [Bacillus licheniformis]TWL93738.1 hypothetical protein CHCC15292_4543 [Bacillus licheniformis]